MGQSIDLQHTNELSTPAKLIYLEENTTASLISAILRTYGKNSTHIQHEDYNFLTC